MKAISLTGIKHLFFNLLIIIVFICLASIPVTYSHFTAKAGTVELVLETGLWDLEPDEVVEQFPGSSDGLSEDTEDNYEDEAIHEDS